MEIKQLEYFAAAVEYGSLNRAAEKLYTTQPNVSRVGQAFDGMEAQDRRSVVDSLQKYFRRLQKDIQREISPQERKQPEQNRTVR